LCIVVLMITLSWVNKVQQITVTSPNPQTDCICQGVSKLWLHSTRQVRLESVFCLLLSSAAVALGDLNYHQYYRSVLMQALSGVVFPCCYIMCEHHTNVAGLVCHGSSRMGKGGECSKFCSVSIFLSHTLPMLTPHTDTSPHTTTPDSSMCTSRIHSIILRFTCAVVFLWNAHV